MEKHNRKLEKKKELGRYNVSFNHPDLIPTVEQTFNIFDSQQAGKRIGTLQILFDFIQNQVIL